MKLGNYLINAVLTKNLKYSFQTWAFSRMTWGWGDVKIQIAGPRIRVSDSACLTNSQVMLMLLVLAPHFENKCFLPGQRKNVLGFLRCFEMNEGTNRDLFLAEISRIVLNIKYVLNPYNVSNTMLGIKGNVRNTDISALCSGRWAVESGA